MCACVSLCVCESVCVCVQMIFQNQSQDSVNFICKKTPGFEDPGIQNLY